MASGNLFGGEQAEAPARQSSSGTTVYAHCDGGARGNPGPAGYGAVITAEDGQTLAELSEYLGKRTNNFAEYSGLLGVLAWTLEHGHRSLRVVSDSELMVKQIQGRYKVNSPDLRPLFDEAKKRIGKLQSFQITHALRHKNKDADRLANEAMDRGSGKSPRASEPAPVRQASPVRTQPLPASREATPAPASAQMLRGFVRDGVVHLLGGHTLPDGKFVKIIAE